MRKIIFLLTLLGGLNLFSQNLMDLRFAPSVGYSQQSNFNIYVSFKIFDISNLDSVRIYLSEESGNEIVLSSYAASLIGNDYYLGNSTDTYPIEQGNFVSLPVWISSSDYENLSEIRVIGYWNNGTVKETSLQVTENN